MDPASASINRMNADPIGTTKYNGTLSSTPSDGVAGNPFIPYFGQPNGHVQYNARDAYHADRRDLPHAYIGKNNFLREVVDGSIMGNRENWYTTLALPFVRNENMTISWSTWTFDGHVVGRVPHEGISRVITNSEKGQSEKVTRRGIGMTLEYDFWKTERGQKNYYYNLMQIRDSVQMTCNYDVLTTLLTVDYHDQQIEQQLRTHALPVEEYLRSEIRQFGIAQKDAKGLEITIENMLERLNRLNVTPNLFIVPPRMRLYLTMVSEYNTSYAQQGVKAVQTFDQGPSSRNILRGKQTVTTDTFSVYEQSNAPIDLLARNRDTGAYFCMFQSTQHRIDQNYQSEYRSVRIYDEDSDQISKISIRDMIENCYRFDKDGDLDKTLHYIVTDKSTEYSRDIFVYKDETSKKTKLCERWGDMEYDNLSDDVMKRLVQSVSNLQLKAIEDEAKRKKITTLKSLFPSVEENILEAIIGEIFEKVVTPNAVTTDPPVTPNAYTTGAPGMGAPFDEQNVTPYKEWHNMNKKLLIESNLATLPYENALMFTNNRMEFIEKMRKWLTGKKDDLSKLSPSYNKLKKFNVKSKRDKISDFNNLLVEMELISPTESLDLSTDEVSETLEFPTVSQNNIVRQSAPELPMLQRINMALNDLSSNKQSNVYSASRREPIGSGSRWSKKTRDINSHVADILGGPLIGDQYIVERVENLRSKTINTKNLNNRLEKPVLFTDEAMKMCYYAFILQKITKKSLVNLEQNDILIPVNFMGVRLFIRHRMYSMILMKGGLETGATFIGHTGMMLSDDGATKMHHGNYTFNHKAIVMQKKNVIVANDVQFGGYGGGNGTSFFTENEVELLRTSNDTILRRRNRPSIMAIMLPATFDQFRHDPIDISGWYKNDNESKLSDQHYPTSQYYNKVLGFNSVASNRMSKSYIHKFLKLSNNHNTIVCADQYEYWSRDGFNGFKMSKSHLGNNLYSGVRSVFAGDSIAIRQLNRLETM